MSYAVIEPQKTALVFFDMLNAYFHAGDQDQWLAAKPMVDNCRLILDTARPAGIPIYFARADHRHDGRDAASLYNDTDIRGVPWPDPEEKPFKPYLMVYAGDWSSEVIPELDPQPGDYMVAKHRWNAFYQTHLELSLRTAGIDTIILCGGATDVGIVATAYAARDMDFNVIIASDACRSGNQDSHDHLMNRMFPFMARVRTADEVVRMIKAGI